MHSLSLPLTFLTPNLFNLFSALHAIAQTPFFLRLLLTSWGSVSEITFTTVPIFIFSKFLVDVSLDI